MMKMSVFGRAIAVGVFLRDGGAWKNVAVYEGVCGLSLALALGWDGFYAAAPATKVKNT